MVIALKISKLGYYGGSPENVLNANVDHVLSILDYENFNHDFEKVFSDINKPEGS